MRTQLPSDAFVILDDAIIDQQVVQIKLAKTWRTIEPYMMGLHEDTGKSVVYGFCRDVVPSSTMPSRWQLFDLEDIQAVEVTNYSFRPHVDYEGDENGMRRVYRKLKPAPEYQDQLSLQAVTMAE